MPFHINAEHSHFRFQFSSLVYVGYHINMRLLVLSTLLALASCREKRSIGSLPSFSEGFSSIGNFFRSPTPPPHSNAPVWKVHKYSGVQLRPVSHEELAAIQPPERVYNEHGHLEIDGHPPKAIKVHLPDYRSDTYHAADGETRRALAAIDSLGGLASFLPEDAQGRSLGRLKRSDEPEAEDRIGRRKRKKGLKLKKKALLALLKGSPVFGKFGGLGGLGGFGGLNFGSLGFGNLFGGGGESEEVEVDIVQEAPAPYPGPTGPYPGPIGPYPPASHTTVYRTPTHSPGFFEGFGFGGRGQEGLPVELPEPSLPQLPQLKLVPEAPKLPPVTLPGNYKIPYSTGSYVSIKVPKPVIPVHAPAVEYGPPAPEYGLPAVEYGPPAVEYGPPAIEYGPPAVEYGPPAVEYGPPRVEYGPPPVQLGPPPTEYGSPLPAHHSHSDIFLKDTFDNVLHHQQHAPQVVNEHFLPSAPAPPVYNAYQGEVNSYQAPVHEYSQTVDTTAVSGVYPAPPPVATAVYNYYPPPQGYSYHDNAHAPSDPKPSVVASDKGDTADDNTENPLNEQMQIPKELEEELTLPKRTDVPTEEEPSNN